MIQLAITAILVCMASADTRRVVRDQHGRQVIYHGVNVVYKIAPYIPIEDHFDSQNSLSDKDIDDLARWGMNLVRLGVMWEAVETAPGVYNQTYLKEIDELITKLGDNGIYTLVDAHQDVMARAMCGEGMPNFYAKAIIANGTYCFGEYADYFLSYFYKQTGFCKSMDDYGFRKDENGNPLIKDCQTIPFFTYYTSPESWTVFRELWTNKNGLQDKYVAYWDAMTKALAPNPYIVGFDPTNEPLPSWTSLTNALWKIMPESGNFDRYDLTPMYERIFEVIKKYKGDSYMWFEPGQFPDEVGVTSYLNWVFELGFDKPPGAEIGSRNHILNDHTYCCQIVGTCDATGEPQAETAAMCQAWHEKRINTRDADAKALGIPLAITEFGSCLDTDDCVREITQVADICDDKMASWAYWQFKTYNDLTSSAGNRSEGFYNLDGTLQTKKVKSLSRTYIQAAQGDIVNMKFDVNTGEFNGNILVNTDIKEWSVLYLHANDTNSETSWYPNGYDFEIKWDGYEPPAAEVNMDQGNNTISFFVQDYRRQGQNLIFKVTPKKQMDNTEFIQ